MTSATSAAFIKNVWRWIDHANPWTDVIVADENIERRKFPERFNSVRRHADLFFQLAKGSLPRCFARFDQAARQSDLASMMSQINRSHEKW